MTARRTGHPPCVVCNGPVLERLNESIHGYARRQTCGPHCEHDLRAEVARRNSYAHLGGRGPWPRITDPGEARLPRDAFTPYEIRLRPQPGRVSQPATLLVRGSAIAGND